MRPKLILLALCLLALGVMLGQNESALVGLPQYGVTLTGSAEHPEIVNNSGRTVLGYIIWFRDANGVGPVMPTLRTREMRLPLVRPASAPAPTATSAQVITSNPIGPIVQAILEAVIFGDGQFVGMARGKSFDILSARVDAERSLAQAVSGKHISWDELQALFNQLRETRTPQGSIEESARQAAQLLAGDLLSMRRAYGEAAALTIADWSAKRRF